MHNKRHNLKLHDRSKQPLREPGLMARSRQRWTSPVDNQDSVGLKRNIWLYIQNIVPD